MKDKIYKASVPLLKSDGESVQVLQLSHRLCGTKQVTCSELKITGPITILNFATDDQSLPEIKV